MNPTRALLVGVSHYLEVPSLPEAVRYDVTDLAGLLRNPAVGGMDASAVTILMDEDATAAAMRAAFANAAAETTPEGTFLFYFSGHGERATLGRREQSWLLPHDGRLTDLAATALSSEEIATLLRAVPSRRQVLIIDACHAGGIGAVKAGRARPKGFGKAGVDALAQGAGRVLLTSSRADETSGILIGARNSIFTTTLIEALNGAAIDRGDGVIGVLDVFEYVSQQVPQRAEQHPVFHAGSLETNFAIARRPACSKSAAPKIDELLATFRELYPAGPTQDELWSRAGGDVSRLLLGGTGAAQWHSALMKVIRGGGGLTLAQLARAALADYPGNAALAALAAAS